MAARSPSHPTRASHIMRICWGCRRRNIPTMRARCARPPRARWDNGSASASLGGVPLLPVRISFAMSSVGHSIASPTESPNSSVGAVCGCGAAVHSPSSVHRHNQQQPHLRCHHRHCHSRRWPRCYAWLKARQRPSDGDPRLATLG